MTVDLSALDAANKALQADKNAAKTTKAFGQAATDAIHALNTPPAPTTPPPSPLSPGLLDDMRAIHMTAMSATGAVVNPDGTPNGQPDSTVVRSQAPAGFWSSLLYTNNDITLIPDARFGQVYRVRTNGQSRNPYWSSPTTCNADLEKDRTLSVGTWDWYGLAVMWEAGWDWTKTDWQAVAQFGYPTIASPPVMIGAGYGDQIYVQRYGGQVVNGSIADPNGFELQKLYTQSVTATKWLEFVVGVLWGAHNDGELHVLARCKDLGDTAFTERYAKTGINTWQWGGSLNAPQDANGFGVVDKIDSYWGYKAGITDANAPTTYVQHTGHVRAADKASVLAVMG